MNNIPMTDAQALLFKRLAENHIYRYDEDLCLYKYVSIDTAKLILENSSLRFSTPAELNDKDLELCLFNVNLSHKQIQRMKAASVKRGLKQKLKLDKKAIKKALKVLPVNSMNVSDEQYKEIILEGYRQQHDKVRLFCATTSFTNERMWEKYADNHQGVCIEYKFPTLFNKAFFGFKVLYDKEFRSFDLYDSKARQQDVAFYRWLFTKRLDYAFEDEVRLISENPNPIYSFPKEVFTGVFYGKNTSESNIDELERLLVNGYSFKKLKQAIY